MIDALIKSFICMRYVTYFPGICFSFPNPDFFAFLHRFMTVFANLLPDEFRHLAFYQFFQYLNMAGAWELMTYGALLSPFTLWSSPCRMIQNGG
jgi:hypothetical protein